MIIQIRGTSGSGKSTAMRRIMEGLPPPDWEWSSLYVNGRKKPLYYHKKAVVVLGHYESNCGGCDTLGAASVACKLAEGLLGSCPHFKHVLCEGLLLSEDVKWSKELKDLSVIFLTTDLETCLKQIEKRRKEVGNEKPLNPANTANRVATIERARLKLIEAGIYCRRASADQASELVLKWLEEKP